jgi:hypothetical protein
VVSKLESAASPEVLLDKSVEVDRGCGAAGWPPVDTGGHPAVHRLSTDLESLSDLAEAQTFGRVDLTQLVVAGSGVLARARRTAGDTHAIEPGVHGARSATEVR